MSQIAVLTKEIGLLRKQNDNLLAKVKLFAKFKSLAYEQQNIMRYLQKSYSETMRGRADEMVLKFEELLEEKKELYKEVKDE